VYGNNFIAAVDYQSLTANATGSSASGTATWASTLSTGAQSGIAIDTSVITLNTADLSTGE
jgi:hypothetical protein